MRISRKTLSMSGVLTLALVALSVGARGQVGDGGLSIGPGGTGAIQLRGQVICTSCYLDEVQNTPFTYQLTHKQGRLVMNISWISNLPRWNRVVWPPQLRIRGEEHLLRQLEAEKNLFKEVEITGILGNSRTLDISAVTVSG